MYLFPADASGAQPGPVIATYAPSIATRILINGQPVTGGAQSRSTAQPVEIQLLSNGQQTVQANMNGSNPAWAHPFYQLSINQPSGGSADTQIFLWPTVVPVPGTCSVPDQTVTLPAVKASQFSGVGSTAGARSFDIQFNNCPWGYGRVGYTFVPVGGSPTMYTGALPLSANSTASGVGIQIVNASGSPVMFNNSIQLAAYNPSTGGSYSLPHTASYIQTADSITSGSVNGSMQVLVDYQ